ncbi:ATP-dependent DNA helicase [Hymenobacter aerophilus]|uniref:ATP-dependent DNA helicase n=1 Tax=Hymenobacter aerophilus TaxID=119644 RepID=UPI00039BFEDA|nr:DEAD/DEAH box helicase [Hymenobacter aerophilus]
MKELLEEYIDNPEAQDVINLINYTDQSIFLTGKAGTGKSTLLKKIIKCTKKNYIILAPTGIAALNVGGQTIHSFFQLEPRPYLPFDKDISILPKKAELLEKLDLIIIDEISMVRCDLMNAIDLALRRNLRINIPFAGKQLLLIGDLFQLPPVLDNRKVEEVNIINSNYRTPYFFSAKALENEIKYHIIELQKVYRQKDEVFVKLLNVIRENYVRYEDLTFLNQRYNPNYISESKRLEIILATTNDIVRQTNQKELQKLPSEQYQFQALSTGTFLKEQNPDKLPAERFLQLCEGSQIMFIKNDKEKRWVNGSLGKIVSISQNSIKAKIDTDNQIYDIQKEIWENYDYVWNIEEEKIEKSIIGTFTQFPIKLAWAVTIHKSQGQTFDKVVIDMGNGAFATGQTYVALSRCRSFEGITLKTKINSRDIKVDERIKEYFNSKNPEVMNREKFEDIVKGMRTSLNTLEPLNIELSSQLKQLNNEILILRQSIKSKESTIMSFYKENEDLKLQVLEITSKIKKQKMMILALLLTLAISLYKVFA